MIVTEDGAVVGSIDVAALAELQPDHPDLRGTTADPNAEEPEQPEADTEEGEDLSALSKAELVERAQAAGLDTEGLYKADLVAALQGLEGS